MILAGFLLFQISNILVHKQLSKFIRSLSSGNISKYIQINKYILRVFFNVLGTIISARNREKSKIKFLTSRVPNQIEGQTKLNKL